MYISSNTKVDSLFGRVTPTILLSALSLLGCYVGIDAAARRESQYNSNTSHLRVVPIAIVGMLTAAPVQFPSSLCIVFQRNHLEGGGVTFIGGGA